MNDVLNHSFYSFLQLLLLLLQCYTISRNGRLNVWECDTKLNGLVEKTEEDDEEEQEESEHEGEEKKTKAATVVKDETMGEDEEENKKIGIRYKKKAK